MQVRVRSPLYTGIIKCLRQVIVIYIEDVTQWQEAVTLSFMFELHEQYLMNECIKFISPS